MRLPITFADDVYIAPKYDILVSANGETWVTVVSVADNKDGQRRVHSFAPQAVRYIRIADTQPRASGSMRLAEVEVYSVDGEVKVATLTKPEAGEMGVDVNTDIVVNRVWQ